MFRNQSCRNQSCFVFLVCILLVILVSACRESGSKEPRPDEPISEEALPEFPKMPSSAEEEPRILATTASLAEALAAGDVGAAAQLFTPELRERQEEWFLDRPEVLEELATALNSTSLSALSEENGWQEGGRRRSAEVRVAIDGKVFFLQLEKVDGVWLMRDF